LSYLFIVVIGAICGWIAGRMLKGNDLPIYFDPAVGAVGAAVIVLISRMAGPAAAAGFFMSFIVSIIGGAAAVYAARMIMKPKPVPVTRRRRS